MTEQVRDMYIPYHHSHKNNIPITKSYVEMQMQKWLQVSVQAKDVQQHFWKIETKDSRINSNFAISHWRLKRRGTVNEKMGHSNNILELSHNSKVCDSESKVSVDWQDLSRSLHWVWSVKRHNYLNLAGSLFPD